MIKMHLTKGGMGTMGVKNACGRGLNSSHFSTTWENFKKESSDRQCEACAKSKQAEFNRKQDEKKSK